MPAFYILAFVAVILFWFGCGKLFPLIGETFLGMYEDVEKALTETEDEENENN